MRDMNLRGVRDVFSFTLRQYMKSKSTIASMVIMLAVAMGGLLIGSLNSGDEARAISGGVYIEDAAQTGVTIADIALIDARFEGLRAADAENCDAEVSITRENGHYLVRAWGEGDEIDASALERAAIAAAQAKLSGGEGVNYSTRLVSQAEYFEPQPDKEAEFEGRFAVSYAYSLIVMMLVIFSTMYIIRAIIEEKDSKLVELLMVSVSPLALITGKIIAAMCVVLIELGALALGAAGAYFISEFALDGASVAGMLGGMGVSDALSNMNLFAIIATIFAIILGFFTFSILGGVLGACCTTIDDTNSASLTVTFIALAGYVGSIFIMMFDSPAASIISALAPVLCVYCAPMRYAMGDISAWMLLLSLALQAVQVALLFRFCANVYGELIMRRGARVKLKQLFSLARRGARAHV